MATDCHRSARAPVLVVLMFAGLATTSCTGTESSSKGQAARPATSSTTTTVVVSEGDRIAGASVRWRVLKAEDPDQPYADIRAVGQWRTDDASRFGGEIPASARAAIEDAVAPRSVEWITPSEADSATSDDERTGTQRPIPVVEVGRPSIDADTKTATVEAGISCGSLCGHWGRAALKEGVDGAWSVTGPDGPQTIS